MYRTTLRTLLGICLSLTVVLFAGCKDQKTSAKPPVPDPGSGYRLIDASWLSNPLIKWCQVANEELSWQFEKETVEISSNGGALSREVVADILAKDLVVKRISASWELVDGNQKLRLYDITVDGADTDIEIELPIIEAGEAHLDLGSQQYISRARN